MDDSSLLPTNDLIKRLVAGLSPEAGELYVEMQGTAEAVGSGAITEAEGESRIGGFLERLQTLPGRDQEALIRLQRLHAAADQRAAERHMETARQAQAAAAVIERAQELELADGRERAEVEAMTLGEVLAVLERHGEDPTLRR